jgi:FtsH ternary system domain X6
VMALVRHASALQKWDAQARTIGYFDEGYAAAQLWKSDWEAAHGAEICQHADAILREIEPLK